MKKIMVLLSLAFLLECVFVRLGGAECNECNEWQNMNSNVGDLSGILSNPGSVDSSEWPGGSNWSGATGEWTENTTLEKITEWLTGQVDFETEQSTLTDWLNNNAGGVNATEFFSSAVASGVELGGGSGTVAVSLPNGSFDLSFVGCEDSLTVCGYFLVAFSGLLGLLVFLH